jgi:hypothetical protein
MSAPIPDGPVPLGPIVAQIVARLALQTAGLGVHDGKITTEKPTMPPDAVADTVALLEDLSRRAAELVAVLPSLELDQGDLAALAGEVQRINSRLADAEERVAWAEPVSGK